MTKSHAIGDKVHYQCPCGQIVLPAQIFDYLEPCLDKDGKRAKVLSDLVAEAWDKKSASPCIDVAVFDRRLVEAQRLPSWWKRFFRS